MIITVLNKEAVGGKDRDQTTFCTSACSSNTFYKFQQTP